MRKSRAKRPLPTIPSNTYVDFSQLLREQLLADPSRKAGYLSEVFESKLVDGGASAPPDVRRDRAIDKWLGREVVNRDTNCRLMLANEEDFLFLDSSGFPVSARDVIDWCKQQISHLLGDEIPWDRLKGLFSGGASTSVKRGVGTVPRKYQDGTNITESAKMAYMTIASMADGLPHELTIVEGNVMFTVPKTAEIDRVACKEPELNMYCQRAVGEYLRSVLRKKGVDLDDQSVNQGLARIGSVDGSLATIDLSSASDSVTTQIVTELFPFEWTTLLMDLRSPFTFVRGEWHRNEMIASMGNGFTFELESFIFWILVRACSYFTRVHGRINVYGDDIICPVGLRDSVEATLSFFGFTVNPEKSFWAGTFRESCGKHYDLGVDISPFYVKETPKTVPDWIHVLNSLRKWADLGGICDPTYYDLWALFSELIPISLHGSRDLARKDALVRPYMRNVAVVRPLVKVDDKLKAKYQAGAYTQWLDSTELRSPQVDILPATEQFSFEGELVVRRTGRRIDAWHRDVPVFPQECGV